MSDARASVALDLLGAPRFVNVLSTSIVGTAASSFVVQRLTGWPGLIGVLSTLAVLAVASGIVRREALDWQGILPISLLVFVAWVGLSIIWSHYQWVTLSSALYFLVYTVLAVYIALNRDMMQIVRIFGNVLRTLLALSLAIEIFSGLLIDSPIRFLGVRGHLADGGPIEGIAGDSARLGLLALVAAVSFAIELFTRSVRRSTSIISLVGAAGIVLLTHSTVVFVISLGTAVVGLMLISIRRARPDVRQPISWALLAVGVVGAGAGFVFRSTLLEALQSSDQVANRLGLWRSVVQLAQTNSLQGWGWVGRWRTEIDPFSVFWQVRTSPFASAYNGFLDVWFQLGVLGLLLFLVLIGLAFVRAWLLAIRQVSIVYLWPALVLIALIASALTESAILVEFGWLTLVICVVKSANKLSWRLAFERISPRLSAPELRRR